MQDSDLPVKPRRSPRSLVTDKSSANKIISEPTPVDVPMIAAPAITEQPETGTDVSTGQPLQELKGHSGPVESVAFSELAPAPSQWDNLTVVELKAALRERALSFKGNKAEMIARLQESECGGKADQTEDIEISTISEDNKPTSQANSQSSDIDTESTKEIVGLSSLEELTVAQAITYFQSYVLAAMCLIFCLLR
jgi:hypothetical protein